MPYSLVSHHYWDAPGGGQLVCAAAAHFLDKANLKPVLTATATFRPEKYTEWFGIDLSRYERVVIPIRLRRFGLYSKLFLSLPIKKALERYKPYLVFTDEVTYKPVLGTIKKNSSRLIEYTHFPYELSIKPESADMVQSYQDDPYLSERYGHFPMNLYFWGYTKLLPAVLRKDPFESADLVLTNSRWTAEIIKDFYGEMPEVLNPPIPPNTEISAHPKPFEERSNSIVMLGRFSEEKRYHWVVSDLLPALRKDMDAKLYIIGGARTPSAANYLNKIGKLAIRAGFRVSRELKSDSDVYLLGELKREEINMVMDLGKVFFHATINEHWGIAIAEGMARALPVVVHRSGGAWSDLVEVGQCGLGYGNGEAAGMLSRLLADRDVWSHYSRKAIERARGLTLDNFVSRFDSLLRTRSMI